MTSSAAARHRLTDLFCGRARDADVHYHAIELLYTTRMNTEVRVELQEPQHLAQYLRAAFYGTDPLLARFERENFGGNVFVNIPGTITTPKVMRPERRLARLCFNDQEEPCEISFGEDFESVFSEIPRRSFDGPPLPEFITALTKAGSHWEKLSLRPSPNLRLLRN